ncbi:MAG: thioredoxin domain-containing protein [Gammaproteobacteria bacterium]
MSNRLANETSPYLQQHAGNPVDWYPWGEEALSRARDENRLILLSIGYSACHWCHVMAHESFEDETTARVMNDLFVNIKVDREERPDLDKIYQNAHYLLAQRPGGWPLTVILEPGTQLPFFAGTYFPPEPRHGLPAFPDLLRKIDGYYRAHPEEVERQNALVIKAMAALQSPTRHAEAPTDMNDGASSLRAAREALAASFDARNGGFGAAPKFPHPSNLVHLLRQWAGEGDPEALNMACLTLEKMARGGIYDQLGGGFCRYSVDDRWSIPHFEKMLYDNGPLLALYTQAYEATGTRLFMDVAMETAEWAMNEMQSEEGGFYSSLDADSPIAPASHPDSSNSGSVVEEGAFYVWDLEELRALLSEDEYDVIEERYGLKGKPNFEGRWHLNVRRNPDRIAERLRMAGEDVGDLLSDAHRKLLAARDQRPRPGRDEKILVSWNALMIRGMALAARSMRDLDMLESAEAALGFIHDRLWRDGRLLATYKDGRAHLNAYLDDYAYLIDAILELLQVRWRSHWLDWAVELAEALLERFEDKDEGGFFFTASDHETLLQRPKPLADEAMPAGNGIAAFALARLGHLLGEPRYTDAAERTLRMAWPVMQASPEAHAALLMALEEWLNPPQVVVIRGDGEAFDAWHERGLRGYAPRRLVFAIEADVGPLPGLLGERIPLADSEAVAYVCNGVQCLPPVRRLEDLRSHLDQSESVATPRTP